MLKEKRILAERLIRECLWDVEVTPEELLEAEGEKELFFFKRLLRESSRPDLLGALFGEERLRKLLLGVRPEDFAQEAVRKRVALLRHIFLGESYAGYGTNLWVTGRSV